MKPYWYVVIGVATALFGVGFYVWERMQMTSTMTVSHEALPSDAATQEAVISNESNAAQATSVQDNPSQERIAQEQPPIAQPTDASVVKKSEAIVDPTEPVQSPATKAVQIASQEASSSKLAVKDMLMQSGFAKGDAARVIDTIIVHSSYNSLGDDPYSIKGIIGIYESYGVSAHYLIGRDGDIYRLVREKDIAYHAGVSKLPDGRTDVNRVSVGIELVNEQNTKYTDNQYKALKKLISDIQSRYSITYVLGHSDIAPGRKTDPWNFDWKRIRS